MNEVADLHNWFEELPDAAKLFWTGSLTITADNPPWYAFRRYQHLLSSVWFDYAEMQRHRPRMTWEEYQRTKDFEVWVFRERMKLHQAMDDTAQQREEEAANGWARSPAFAVDGEHEK